MQNYGRYISLIALISVACTRTPYRPESVDQAMARITPKDREANLVPDLEVKKNFSTGRAISSVSKTEQKPKADLSDQSNKRLYFLSLLFQYNEIKKFSKNPAPKIEVCPNFHTYLVDNKELVDKSTLDQLLKISYDTKNIERFENFPEFYLPLTKESVTPKVIDVFRENHESTLDDLVARAIDIHINKTYGELTDLCETGSSDNFFAYENLLVFNNTKGGLKASAENVRILLKTTLFANGALLASFKSLRNRRELANVTSNQYFDEIIDRMGVYWVKEYYRGITKRE